MATISAPRKPPHKVWTVADLYRRFGPIPFERIRQDPPPGLGTVEDVNWLNDHEDRLYELVDGILVMKTMGLEESFIAIEICTLLNNFVKPRGLGRVAGEGGAIQLDIGLVRIPDVSFFSSGRLRGGAIPAQPIPLLVPDLAVEVVSRSNTRKEMDEKLQDYFAKGVRLVWFVRPRTRVVDVYTAPDRFTRLTASMRLDGGDVLPGFSVQVSELFGLPQQPAAKGPPKKNGPQRGKRSGPRRGR
ncbi:MAG TPA: Uma2 family endonuclease [Isosphaeraceae bacterium]|nr:Uma2 family endonuclease [Isosphaeraceae bacterium]